MNKLVIQSILVEKQSQSLYPFCVFFVVQSLKKHSTATQNCTDFGTDTHHPNITVRFLLHI